MLLVPNRLGSIAKIAAKEAHSRYGVTGVKVSSYGDGTYRAESTDGRRLIICTGPSEDEKDYPEIPALASAPNGKAEGVIPAKEFERACATVKKYKTRKPILEHLGLVFGENQTTLASTDLETTSCNTVRNVDGRWVPSNDILPTGKPVVRFRVDCRYLRELLQVAENFTNESDEGITFEVFDPRKPIIAHCSNKGHTFLGVLEPLANSDGSVDPFNRSEWFYQPEPTGESVESPIETPIEAPEEWSEPTEAPVAA